MAVPSKMIAAKAAMKSLAWNRVFGPEPTGIGSGMVMTWVD
jgi:hypothetical protein